MSRQTLLSISLKIFSAGLFICSTLPAIAQRQLKQWEVFELKLKARNNYQNPYADIPASSEGLAKITFSGTSGDAKGKSLKLFAFWDGGQNWKVRFAPPHTGTWNYKTESKDPGLNNISGQIEGIGWSDADKKEHAVRRGFLQVNATGRYFQYADGTPFLWIADTWWDWGKRGIKMASFTNMVDDRASKGFNLGQLFVAANGWGRRSSLLDETFSVLDVGHMQKIDSMIAYANQKGITVWVHGWWSRKDLNKTAGSEKMKRWWRYLIHRLGVYNVIWVVAGEYNLDNYGGFDLAFWKSLGAMIKAEDPYKRIVGVHPTPPTWSGGMEGPQWSTAEVLHQEKWLDYNQSQVGHGRMANEMIPDVVRASYAAVPAKPIVVTEPWYEFIEGNPTGQDIRFGAWSAILSGAAGHTYGGGHVWLAHLPEAPAGGQWPLEKTFDRNTLNYEGAVSMGHLATFFSKIKWWEMGPHPELVQQYPAKYCLAIPGQEYVLYLRWAGTVSIDLRPSTDAETFNYYWFDPATGRSEKARSVKGGAIRHLAAPGGYPGTVHFRDWVLHLKKQ